MLVIVLILVSWLLDSFKDAIAFGSPPGRWMKELWHVVKGLSYAILFFYFIWTSNLPRYWLILIVPILFELHEISYSIFRQWEVWKWDEKIEIPIINKVWNLKGRKCDIKWLR